MQAMGEASAGRRRGQACGKACRREAWLGVQLGMARRRGYLSKSALSGTD
jgi:hypothetical protein